MRKIIMASITAVVVIAVLAGTLIPVLDDATTKSDTFTNDGIVRMTKYDTSAEITAFWDHTAPNQITVNGEIVALPRYETSGTELSLTASGSSTFLLRYVSQTAANQSISLITADNAVAAAVNASTDATITVSGGTLTFSNGSTTISGTFDDSLFFVSNDGDYLMKSPTGNVYVNSDSEIIGIGRTTVGSSRYNFYIPGSIDNGWTAEIMQTNSVTLSDVTATYEVVDSHIDLYSFDKLELTATSNGTDYAITYNQVIVPYEVTAERSVHFTDGENAILNAIPALVIIALLLGVVAIVLRSRME